MWIMWNLGIKAVENRDNFFRDSKSEASSVVDNVNFVDNLWAKNNPDTRFHTLVPGKVVD
ncbi:hypothetical protein HMSSN139_54540 [Paenibacillus sp. HMSSN-139]|nr:hypothetical protein HMSSN139_54540 [Paenibacillus sp. HMSSN-139]